MKNLFLFLWRNNYTIFFILLESFCFMLVIRNNNFHNAAFFNSSNQVTGRIMETFNYLNEYMSLNSVNRSLAEENARLMSTLQESVRKSTAMSGEVNDTVSGIHYKYIAARVVNNSVHRRNNYLTLDKGTVHGVSAEMGVITGSGVIGMVRDVSDHYCTVMSLLHKNSNISARFKQNNYFGPLVWDGDDPGFATLKDIARHVKFQKGDTIVTTSYSSVFPENIMIGTVESFEAKDGDNFYRIRIRLSADFRNLGFVYIVNNLLKNEKQDLESKTAANDQ